MQSPTLSLILARQQTLHNASPDRRLTLCRAATPYHNDCMKLILAWYIHLNFRTWVNNTGTLWDALWRL